MKAKILDIQGPLAGKATISLEVNWDDIFEEPLAISKDYNLNIEESEPIEPTESSTESAGDEVGGKDEETTDDEDQD